MGPKGTLLVACYIETPNGSMPFGKINVQVYTCRRHEYLSLHNMNAKYNTVTNKCIGIRQLTSVHVPHITKHKTDIGQLLHTVLSGRNDLCLWGVLVSGCTCVVEQFYELLCHEHEKWCYIYIQNELTLTKANKLTCTCTCMHHWRSELAKCFTVLVLHWQWFFLPLKMAA